MTTVVNYNIVNVFGSDPDRFGRQNNGHSGKRQKAAPEEDMVIDVTPFSRVVSGAKTDDARMVRFPKNIDRQASAYAVAPSDNSTYNRWGQAVSTIPSKGINIDFVV